MLDTLIGKERLTFEEACHQLLVRAQIIAKPAQVRELWEQREREKLETIEAIAQKEAKARQEVEQILDSPTLEDITRILRKVAYRYAQQAQDSPGSLDACVTLTRVLIDARKVELQACDELMRWHKDPRAVEVMDAPGPQRDKISRLHELMFGEPLRRNGEVALTS